MPVYTYECEECGVRFNQKQSFSDAPIEICPECEGHTHKVIGPVGVVFKGSGFYVTDSRSKRDNLTGSGKKKSDESGSTGSSGGSTQTQAQPSGDKATPTTTASPSKDSGKS